MLDELAGEHGEEYYGNAVSGARGQTTNQVVRGISSQINWLRGQTKRCMGWFRHPPSISELWPLLLLICKTRMTLSSYFSVLLRESTQGPPNSSCSTCRS